jgi:hypothetical protein
MSKTIKVRRDLIEAAVTIIEAVASSERPQISLVSNGLSQALANSEPETP